MFMELMTNLTRLIHVIPAMISKFEEAKKLKYVKLLGTGKPLREFIHAEDLVSNIKSLKLNKIILKSLKTNYLL